MILFKEDWDDYPYAIADVHTTNISWTRYSGLLKSMDIKNHLFPLQLHNPKLVGVDVYSKDLTTTEKNYILMEILDNPFYFFREVLRLTSVGETDVVMMDANRGNISVWWLFFNYVVTYLIQIRQTGKSITIDGLFTLLNEFLSINSSHIIITKDSTLRDENTERLKNMRNNLPGWLKMHGKGDVANTEKITVRELNNEIKILLAQKSKIAANSLGRGLTTHTVGVDEFGFSYNNFIAIPAALTAGSRARENAMKNGLPCGTLFYTTPGHLSTAMGKFAYKYYKNSMPFTEELFDCKNKEELHDRISKSTRGPMDVVLVERNHQQLGITDDQLRKRMKSAGLEGAKAEAEVFNKWIDGSSESVLDQGIIKLLRAGEREINHASYHNGYAINWYVPREEVQRDRVMVAGSDTSEMKGSDDTSIVILDPITGETLGAGKYNKTNIIEYAEGVYDFLKDFYNTIYIIERKSTGGAILDYLLLAAKRERTKYDILKRLYHESDEKLELSDPLITTKIGYSTAGRGKHARSVLFNDVLIDATDTCAGVVRDASISLQLCELEKRNGRVDHPADGNDDMAVGWLLAQWLLRFGVNLNKYGINPHTVLSAIPMNNSQKETLANKNRAMMIHKITLLIGKLIDELAKAGDTLTQMRIRAKIRYLTDKLDKNSVKSLNIEQRIEDSLRESNKAW